MEWRHWAKRPTHCVGHSLGGALASLAADWLAANAGATIKLYTFGSPRVGLDFFVQRAGSRIGKHNIYRTYHKTDPVPMVPTWPFCHLPGNDEDYLLYSPTPAPPWKYHTPVQHNQRVYPQSGALRFLRASHEQ